ncbi:MAG: Crp/Fnr family transcriptional regulator [Planctomycetota bacterium]
MRNERRLRPAYELIRGCELFGGLSDENATRFAESAKPLHYMRGQRVFSQGDPCPGMFIVDYGMIRIFRSGNNAQEHVLHLCGPGQHFAEVATFENFVLPASAEATKESGCLLIPIDVVVEQINGDHEFCRQLLVGMAYWTRHFIELLDDLVLRDATSRVTRYLSSLPCDSQGRLRMPAHRKDVANHLNLTPETFSRVLRRLTDEGILKPSSGRDLIVAEMDRLIGIGEA